jgi:hypothetical protein
MQAVRQCSYQTIKFRVSCALMMLWCSLMAVQQNVCALMKTGTWVSGWFLVLGVVAVSLVYRFGYMWSGEF